MRNRLLGIALGLALGTGVLLWQAGRSGSVHWHLLPENSGAISSIAIQINEESADSLLPCCREFVEKIDPHTKIVVICGSKKEAVKFSKIVQSWRTGRVRSVVVGKSITGWCKDRFLVARGSPETLLYAQPIETGLPARTHDSLVAPALARAYPKRFRAAQLPLRFDSGDILTTGSDLIVSDVLWRKNGNPSDFQRQLEGLFGLRIIWLHNAPDHHIGMFAAPLNDKTIIVGDPRLAKRLWSTRMDENFGRADFSDKTIAPFEHAAEQLAKAGFKVIRVPLAVIGPQTYITYTNGIYETRDNRRIAYIPWYGEPLLDNPARAAYESAGWEVCPIPVGKVYRFRGTIGCLVNVLERG